MGEKLDLPKKMIQVLIASAGICLLKRIPCASGLFGEGKLRSGGLLEHANMIHRKCVA
jgi:hypothetical protein